MPPRTPSVTRALTVAIKATKPAPGDAALVVLAKHLARVLDDQAHLADVAGALYDDARERGDDDLADGVRMLQQKVEQRAVVSDIAPKLLAVLAALKMTPAARATVVEGGAPTGGGPDALDELRQRRRL